MNRVLHTDRIALGLSTLATYARFSARVNLMSPAVHLEDFCAGLLNLVRGWNLRNCNAAGLNQPGIDLLDSDRRRAFQVTIEASSEKVRTTHAGAVRHEIHRVADAITILFFTEDKPPGDPRKDFTPCLRPPIDKLDLAGLLREIMSLPVERQAEVVAFLDRELWPKMPVIEGALRLHTIPAPPTHFIGRTADLEKLRAAAAGPVVITGLRGMGGIGKTALALTLAAEWAPRFPDAQLLLRGRGTSDTPATPASLLEEIIRTFQPASGQLPEDVPSLRERVTSLLHGKRVLLLLDDAAEPAQARALIPPAGCALLVTSRRGFAIDGVAPHRVDRLPVEEALALLTELYPPFAADPASAREIIRLCDGLPLALRIAGAYLALDASERHGTADVPRYLAALEKSQLGTLDRTADDAGEVTVSETLRLSEARLTPDQRRAWHALGVFPAPFDAAAALAIAGAEADTTDRLVRLSLLERAENNRLRLHDLAADYCRGCLDAEALDSLRFAHARHFTAVGWEAHRLYQLGHENVVRGLALFDEERAHLEAAFAFLAVHVDDPARAPTLISLVYAMVPTSALRFHPAHRINWFKAQAEAARTTSDLSAECDALGNIGNAHGDLGDAQQALKWYEQRTKISSASDDLYGEGLTWFNTGNASFQLGEVNRALECYGNAIEIARKIENRHGEALALNSLGH